MRYQKLLALAVAVLSVALALVCSTAAQKNTKQASSKFYDAQGRFSEAAAKEAYLTFLQKHGYIINDNLRKNMWVSDFGLGKFDEIGMAGMFWVDDPKNNYAALEMILLPGQMVPQHRHERTAAAAPKMESWHVRYGTVYAYGEGVATPKPAVTVPAAEKPHTTVFHETVLRAGDVTGISKPLELHWMKAGPEGAFMTEYSTYHDGKAVKFTDPKIKF